jgi:hypothetical protein
MAFATPLNLRRFGVAGRTAADGPNMKKAAHWKVGGFFRKNQDYLILVSLYRTCLRAFGSNLVISIFAGMVRLFLVVV